MFIILQAFSQQFNILNTAISPLKESALDWGDYDNDGDLDIFLMGDTGSGMFSYIFENTNDDFVQADCDLADFYI